MIILDRIAKQLFGSHSYTGQIAYSTTLGKNCWALDKYWVDAATFEEAKILFERYKKLKEFW